VSVVAAWQQRHIMAISIGGVGISGGQRGNLAYGAKYRSGWHQWYVSTLASKMAIAKRINQRAA